MVHVRLWTLSDVSRVTGYKPFSWRNVRWHGRVVRRKLNVMFRVSGLEDKQYLAGSMKQDWD